MHPRQNPGNAYVLYSHDVSLLFCTVLAVGYSGADRGGSSGTGPGPTPEPLKKSFHCHSN